MSEKTFRIGEVATLLELKTSVLRFWESEFPELQPDRSAKGHRTYSEENVELLKRIKHLLHERGMTIEGARRVLGGEAAEPKAARPDDGFMEAALQELQSIRDLLAGEAKA